MSKRLACCLTLLALSASCQKFAEGRQMFRELLALRDQIAAEFHEKVVDVNVAGGDRMIVKFINSPLNSSSGEDKQKRADEVAAFVTSHYNHPLSSVSTQFLSRAGGVGVGETYIGHPARKP